MNVLRKLDALAIDDPGRVALIAAQATYTYADLARESRRVASALLDRGIRPGDRVLIHMANAPEVVLATLACFRVGAIAVPLNIRLKADEVHGLVARLQPSLYLGEASVYEPIGAIPSGELPPERRVVVGGEGLGGVMSWADAVDHHLPIRGDRRPGEDDLVIFITTTGTTGEPKFAAHTLATYDAMAESCAHLGVEPDARILIAFPMMHASGTACVAMTLNRGAAMVLVRTPDPDAILDAINRHRCTWFSSSPVVCAAVAEAQVRTPRDLTSLRHCGVGTDKCPETIHAAFQHAVGQPLRDFWASTEACGGLTYGTGSVFESHILPGTDVRIVDGDGTPSAAGEQGEMLIRFPGMVAGYWRGPGRLDRFEDGYFHSGDLARRNGEELTFVGRKKDLIERAGSNVAPVEVEAVLRRNALVADVAVFGVPDTLLGQRIVAAVRLKPGVAEPEPSRMLDEARTALADYKVPERIVFVPEIPRNALGKIDRAALGALDVRRG